MTGCGQPSLPASPGPAPTYPCATWEPPSCMPGCERPSLLASPGPAPDTPRSTLASVTLDQSAPHQLARSMMDILVEGHRTSCLFDTGSTESFIDPATVKRCGLVTRPVRRKITLASGSHSTDIRSVTGTTLPVWLTSPGPVLLRKHARSNKYSPLVEKVHLLHANPQYAYVVLPDGREDTVSVRDLAPAGAADHYPEHSTVTLHPVPEVTPRAPCPTQTPYASVPGPSLTREGSLTPPVGTELTHSPPSEHTPPPAPVPSSPPAPVQLQPELRRSQRTIRPPDRLNL
ncbi:uncharacterized protein [Hemitrygon akajei]|uniref:uncharacterized protein n=1 Tax=Hemitrygon akajei TaxID=2704970 RepID=UPI003BF9C7C2